MVYMMYLSYANDIVNVTTDRDNNTKVMLHAIANWTRFGEAYMKHMNWIEEDHYILHSAFENYEKNIQVGIFSTITPSIYY